MQETLSIHKIYEDIILKDYFKFPINSNNTVCSKVNGVQLKILYLFCFFIIIGSLMIITR